MVLLPSSGRFGLDQTVIRQYKIKQVKFQPEQLINNHNLNNLFLSHSLNMKLNSNYVVIAFLFLFTACSPVKQISRLSYEAQHAYKQGLFEIALEKYEHAIKLNKRNADKNGFLYNGAGIAAFALNNQEKAIYYLEKARQTPAANAKTFAALAKLYRKIDNLSREITALQTYVTRFANGDEFQNMQIRLFETLVESENYDQAIELWPFIEEVAGGSESLLTMYLQVNRELKNNIACDTIAGKLLKINKNNIQALDWLAKKHFWLAENLYVSELTAYENNKTTRQYRQLLAAIEILNRDFKIALEYFLRLYELNPTREYAQFLGNIYMRFGDKQNERFFHSKGKE